MCGCRYGGGCGCNHAIRNMGFGYVRISCVQGYSVVGVFSCTLLAESVQDDAFSGDVCMKIVYERLFRVHIRCVPEGADFSTPPAASLEMTEGNASAQGGNEVGEARYFKDYS